MHKRFINGDSFSWLSEKRVQVKRLSDFEDGYISKIEILKVAERVEFDGRCYADDGYVWYVFLPDNKNWCLTFQYDTAQKLVEWYIDITHKNCVSDEGVPFHYDLYLDVAVYPDSTVVLLDEDELQDALEDGDITQEMFKDAYHVRGEILDSPLVCVDFLLALSARIRAQFA